MFESAAAENKGTVRRDRPGTEEKLRAAVETLLLKGGLGSLTPSAVAHQAGVDKMLIYRYFGGLAGLARSITERPGFFPSFGELCGGDPEALKRQPPAERAVMIVQAYANALMARPVVLEIMAWELVERTPLTLITESAREAVGMQIITELFGDVSPPNKLAPVTALCSAAITYLLLRRRKIRMFNGLDLHCDYDWRLLLDTLQAMAAAMLAGETVHLQSEP